MSGRKHNISKFPKMKGSESKKVKTLGNLNIPEARMNSTCTVAEVVQISLAASEDVVSSYTGEVNKLIIQQTLFLEALKTVLIDKGIINDEGFNDILRSVAEKYQRERDEYLEEVINREKEGEQSNETEDN